jgi:signal transduction histidine kinase
VVVGVASVVATSVAVLTINYKQAVAEHEVIVRDHDRDKLVALAQSSFWREREAMNEYLLTPGSDVLREVSRLHAHFNRALTELRSSTLDPAARERLRLADAAHRTLFQNFMADRSAAGRGPAPEDLVLAQLKLLEPTLLDALQGLSPADARAEEARRASARADDRRALIAAVLAGLLTIGGGLVFAVYAVRLLRRIRAQNEQLKAFDRLKDDFVASVSHELRTPLTSIRGYLELLISGEVGELNEEQARFLAVVDRNADRLLNVVGDLLFVSQVENGVISLERKPVELVGLLKESVDAARPAAAAKGLAVELVADEVAEVEADRTRLAQVIDNLLSNAIKFTPEGGFVDIALTTEGPNAKILVSDTGMGISPTDQERLFARFFRTAAANEQAIQGTGLGLAIVKAIVEGHGGRITVESEVGMGTTFCVELPLGVREREAVAA